MVYEQKHHFEVTWSIGDKRMGGTEPLNGQQKTSHVAASERKTGTGKISDAQVPGGRGFSTQTGRAV